jgi:acyl dehydratase
MCSPKHALDSLAALHAFIGQPPRESGPTLIEQPTIDAFGSLTHDRQWIHVDPARAMRESPQKTTIAHGFLSLSLLTHWHFDCFEYPNAKVLLNYGFDRIRFTAPVPCGSSLFASFQLLSVVSVREGEARCLWNVEACVVGSDHPALVAHWLMQVRF